MPVEDSKSRKYDQNMNVICYWFLGLANNYGYVVMLSAAHDILANFDKDFHKINATEVQYVRECNSMSTGIILLADVMPSIIVTIVSPFVPLYINLRMGLSILFAVAGFILVAIKINKIIVLLGVVCVSLSCGLGESSLLSYVVFFDTDNVISSWSSGTGGAGIFGAISYAALTAFGLTPVTTLMLMIIVPVLEAVCFYFILEHPKIGTKRENILQSSIPTQADVLTFDQKLKIIPNLLVTYMAPFSLVFVFEYFINQGLFELIYFPDSYYSHAEQYRWYSVLYQIGVFVSRSSMNLIHIDNIWLLAVLQFVNVLICFFDLFLGFIKYVPILMIIIFWEGLVGGASYVNTYRRINMETPVRSRQFCMAMNTFGSYIMISVAGLLAYPMHDIICSIPSVYK